jgi:3-methyladenine DNA glycosylase/8-oxoguanine DNA glycosylase
LTGDEKRASSLTLRRALQTDESISGFYDLAKKDEILADVVKDLYGMRATAWPDLFPAAILAVTLQMAPWSRSSQMMDLLMKNYGDELHFDEKTISYWPSPEKIASVGTEDLKSKAKLGYRAKNLSLIAKILEAGFPSMDDLYNLPYEEAKKKLMELRGIGEYSAELITPRMGFPLDVWSAKIFNILFFKRETYSPREAIPRLKQTAEKRWGQHRGQAFVYILNDLQNISKRIGFDLTRF